jgi:DNA-binding MarR family transcriptional regulator
VRDKRDLMSDESLAFLSHLAASGPLTLTEMSRHFDRAPSTLSEMVEGLVRKGWLTRDRDPEDGRKHLIWLSEEGQAALKAASQVLDEGELIAAAAKLSPEEREMFITLFTRFGQAIKAGEI